MKLYGLLLLLMAASCTTKEQKIKRLYVLDDMFGNVREYYQTKYPAIERFGKPEIKHPFIEKAFYRYDENKIETEETIYADTVNIESRRIATNDADGRRLEAKLYDGKNTLTYTLKYKYDSADNIEVMDECYGEDSLWRRNIYKYDNSHNRTERALYDGADGSLIFKSVAKFDSHNNRIRVEDYMVDTKDITIHKSTFDTQHLMVRDSVFKQEPGRFPRLSYVVKFKRNEFGDIVHRVQYDAEIKDGPFVGAILSDVTTVYNYDKNNNWTKAIQYEKNKAVSVSIREIKYY